MCNQMGVWWWALWKVVENIQSCPGMRAFWYGYGWLMRVSDVSIPHLFHNTLHVAFHFTPYILRNSK